MRLFKTIAGLRVYLREVRPDRSIGFVPTMGALHRGHQSLIDRAVAQNDRVAVSIFVNPLQFGPQEDFQHYPRTLERDCQWCETWGVDAVFAPSPQEMGMTLHQDNNSLAQASTLIMPPAEMMSVLCGPFRPGHFPGVATIVTKLLQIVQPTRAYFGQKDAQQLAIIRRAIQDLNLPVEICPCPIAREPSGLAYSSRNQYLTPAQKEQATVLFRSLQAAKRVFQEGELRRSALISAVKDELSTEAGIALEYSDLVDPQTLIPLERIETEALLAVAAYLGSTRLIDNIILRDRSPIIAIDGPAGVGKSTVTRRLAEALGFLYLDTGAMYRAVTWLVLEMGIAVDDEPAIAELLQSAEIELQMSDSPRGTRVSVNGQDVTQAIRTPPVTAQVSAVSSLAAVRQELLRQQQHWGKKGGIVVEGRDIGTRVFPDAELKIFLTASERERARRRMQDLKAQGETHLTLEQLERAIQQRDTLDSTRQMAPLRKAPEATEIMTDDLGIEEVTLAILKLYAQSFS